MLISAGNSLPSRRRAGTSMTRLSSGPSPVARKRARPRDVSFAELRGDDGFGQDAADRLGPRPAEGDLGLAVPLGDEAVGAHGDEGVVGVVEDEAPALLAGAAPPPAACAPRCH